MVNRPDRENYIIGTNAVSQSYIFDLEKYCDSLEFGINGLLQFLDATLYCKNCPALGRTCHMNCRDCKDKIREWMFDLKGPLEND